MNAFSDPLPMTGLNLNVTSFNIRRGTKKDGKNHWILRRNRVGELLDHDRPDVLGLQEALDFQIAELSAMLPGYEEVGLGNWGGADVLAENKTMLSIFRRLGFSAPRVSGGTCEVLLKLKERSALGVSSE